MKEELMEKIEKIMNNDSETIREVLVDFLKKQVEELESNEPKNPSNYEEAKKIMEDVIKKHESWNKKLLKFGCKLMPTAITTSPWDKGITPLPIIEYSYFIFERNENGEYSIIKNRINGQIGMFELKKDESLPTPEPE